MGADGEECRVKPASLHRFENFVDLGIELELDAEIEDPLYFRIEHVARQSVLGDAEAHHPASRRPGIVYRNAMPHASQMIGRRKTGRSRADHQHAFAAFDVWRRKAPIELDRLVAEEPLDRIDADRFVDLRPIAGALAGVIADPPHHRGHRVVLCELAPCAFVVARFRVVEPRLDVFAGWTGMIARRQAIHIDRTHGAPGAGEISETAAAIERYGERMCHHASSSASSILYSAMLLSAIACSLARRCEPAASLNKFSKRRCGLRYSVTGTGRRIFRLLVTMPCSASKTGNSPDSTASRASRTVSCEAEPQPSGHGT